MFFRQPWRASRDWRLVSEQVTAVTAVVTAILVVRQLGGLRDDPQRADDTLRAQTAQSRSEAESARANLLLQDRRMRSGFTGNSARSGDR